MERVEPGIPASHTFGRNAERMALRYLLAMEWGVLRCNYRISGGEIDIIARDANALVFIEVRARKFRGLVSAPDSVDGKKQRRIIFVARNYLCREKQGRQASSWAKEIRFDVIAFGDNGKLLHYRGAFY